MSHHATRASRHRALHIESLEQRLVLASHLVAFQNPLEVNDVNNDDYISPMDALLVINRLNAPDVVQTKVASFLDTSGDRDVSSIDALRVINDLNGDVAHANDAALQFDILVGALEAVPTTLQGELGELSVRLIASLQAMEDTENLFREELNEFLEFSSGNEVALQHRLDEIREGLDFSTHVLETEIQDYAQDFINFDVSIFANEDFERVGGGPIEIEDGEYPDFDHEDFSWDYVADLGDGLAALFDDLEGLTAIDVAINLEDLTEESQSWVTEYEGMEGTLADYLVGAIDAGDTEQWLLEEGHDVADLIDSIFGDLEDSQGDLVEFIEDYFEDTDSFVEFLDEELGDIVIGQLQYGDHVAIGGETTGTILVMSDQEELQIDFGVDETLHNTAEALDGQTVIISGELEASEGPELPGQLVLDAEGIISLDLANQVVASLGLAGIDFGADLASLISQALVPIDVNYDPGQAGG